MRFVVSARWCAAALVALLGVLGSPSSSDSQWAFRCDGPYQNVPQLGYLNARQLPSTVRCGEPSWLSSQHNLSAELRQDVYEPRQSMQTGA